jgi:hypothetical protein
VTTEIRRKCFTKHAELARSASTSTTLFTLPAGAYIEDIIVHNSATAAGATISIGTAASATYFVNAQSVSTAGLNRVTCTNTQAVLSDRVAILGLIGGAPVAGGPFRVAVRFSTQRDKGHI